MHEYEEWQKSLGEEPNRVAEIVEVPSTKIRSAAHPPPPRNLRASRGPTAAGQEGLVGLVYSPSRIISWVWGRSMRGPSFPTPPPHTHLHNPPPQLYIPPSICITSQYRFEHQTDTYNLG